MVSARKKLAVIVPCHNETANVSPFYEAAKLALDALPLDWALVFVNDASTDDTLDKILALRKTDPRVRVASPSPSPSARRGDLSAERRAHWRESWLKI